MVPADTIAALEKEGARVVAEERRAELTFLEERCRKIKERNYFHPLEKRIGNIPRNIVFVVF